MLIDLNGFAQPAMGKRRRKAAERLPSEVAKASKEIPSQERRQICINRAMPADFSHHAVKELEPLAIIYCQWPAAVVESRCGAVVLGSAYLLPALSVAGASLALPWLRFHIPLIKPGVRFSRTGLSDKAVLIFCFTRSPTNSCRYVRWSWCNPSFWCRC